MQNYQKEMEEYLKEQKNLSIEQRISVLERWIFTHWIHRLLDAGVPGWELQ